MTSSSRQLVVFGGCTTGGYAGDCNGKKLLLRCYVIMSYYYVMLLLLFLFPYFDLSYLLKPILDRKKCYAFL